MPDLVLFADQAAVHGRAGRTHRRTECPGQVVDQLKVLLAANPAATGYDHPRALQVDLLLLAVPLDDLDGRNDTVELDLLRDDIARALRIAVGKTHHAFADGGHLRPSLGINDGGDDVSAEGRSNLQQKVLVCFLAFGVGIVADVQVGAVGGQSGLHFRSNTGRQISPQRRRSVQDDLRLVLADQFAHDAGVGQRAVVFQQWVVNVVDIVHAVCDQSM